MIGRRRRRRAGIPHIPHWVYSAVGVVLALACWIIPLKPRLSPVRAQPDASLGGETSLLRVVAEKRRGGRPTYRHSVIAGGAYSVAEVERARRADPVVNAHYSVFDTARLRITEAPAPRSVYVSYRIGSGVFWTRNRVQLAAGEALITDGGHMARARCGNRVADTPQPPVAADEPAAADLDVVELPIPAETDLLLPPALVVDLFPPAPLSPMAQSSLAIPGISSSPSSPVSGVGMLLATGAGLAGRAEGVSGSAVSPGTAVGNVPPGPSLFVPGLWPTGVVPLWNLPMPGPIAIALLPPNLWLPSTTGLPAGPSPVAGAWGTFPQPGTWPSWTPPVLPGLLGTGGGPPKTGGTPGVGGSPATGDTPGVVLPPLVPGSSRPETPVDLVPENGTAMLVAAGVVLLVISRIRRHG